MLETQLRDDGLTLEEVATELGVSVERARQIEMAALRKCRRWCQRHGWRYEDLVPAWPQPEPGWRERTGEDDG